jgi:hypothetical protein
MVRNMARDMAGGEFTTDRAQWTRPPAAGYWGLRG